MDRFIRMLYVLLVIFLVTVVGVSDSQNLTPGSYGALNNDLAPYYPPIPTIPIPPAPTAPNVTFSPIPTISVAPAPGAPNVTFPDLPDWMVNWILDKID